MRWAKAGNPAAFLIHHQIRAGRQRLPQRSDQAGELIRVLDVPAEQNDTRGRESREQRGFLNQQGRAGDADNGGLGSQIRIPLPSNRHPWP